MARRKRHTRRTARSNPRGILSIRRNGYGFVSTSEGEFFVPAKRMRGAFDGDTVEVAFIGSGRSVNTDADSGHKRVVRVVRVIEHAHTHIIGTYKKGEPFDVVIPTDKRIPCDFFVRHTEDEPIPEGSLVRVRITCYPSPKEAATGIVEEVLGASDDERAPLDVIVAQYKLETQFSQAALTQASSAHVDAEEALKAGYADLRDRLIITIDPTDARDFDDAVSWDAVNSDNAVDLDNVLDPKRALGSENVPDSGDAFDPDRVLDSDTCLAPNARWRLGVHIADVSHYVPWGSSLDLDARRRATSVYLVDRVISMLPEALSNDVCSLRPGEDRRSLTVDMYLDEQARIVDTRVYPAVIRSARRLTYDQAQALLDLDGQDAAISALFKESDKPCKETGEPCKETDELLEEHDSPFEETDEPFEERDEFVEGGLVLALKKRLEGVSWFAKKRSERRSASGGLDFDTQEAKVILDAALRPVRVELRSRTQATQLIEEAMIAANETIAALLRDAHFPCLYRVHEKPSVDVLKDLAATLEEFSWFDAIDKQRFESGNPHEIARTLLLAAARPEATLVTTLVLRSMKRAVYSPCLLPHYALASKAYAHFTSPIRRYPDLVVHRMVKAYLQGKTELFDQEVSALGWLAEHSSERERVAEQVARESQEIKLIELMELEIGKVFSALIVGVANYGLFVRLENTAEGIIPIRDLGSEYFALDALRHTLLGEDSGKCYRLGAHMAVRLVEADHMLRVLRFKPVGKG